MRSFKGSFRTCLINWGVILSLGLCTVAEAKSYSSGKSSSSSSKYSSGSSSSSSSSSSDSSYKKKKYSSGSSTSPSPSPSPSSSWNAVSKSAQSSKSANDYQAYKAKQQPQPVKQSSSFSSPAPSSPSPSPSSTVYVQQPRTTVVVHRHYYRDNYGYWDGAMTGWLMQQNLETRTAYLYNHRSEFSDDQYRALVSKDAQLEARLKNLETSGVQRDPSAAVPPPPPAEDEPEDNGTPAWEWLLIVCLVGGIGFAVWRVVKAL